jgi:multicomponent Na+:H+ antiporter subunit F
VSFVLVMLGVAFAFVRLMKGPSLPDRIVALDMMTVLIVSFCGLYAILSEDTAFVDVAIVLALVGFLRPWRSPASSSGCISPTRAHR